MYDDREVSAGEKFADSDLIGIPYRVVVSKRSIADGGFEVKKRTEVNGKILKKDELMDLLKCTYDPKQSGMFVWAKIPADFDWFKISDNK